MLDAAHGESIGPSAAAQRDQVAHEKEQAATEVIARGKG